MIPMTRIRPHAVLMAAGLSLSVLTAMGKETLSPFDQGHAGDMCRVLGLDLADSRVLAKAYILNDMKDGFPFYIDNRASADEFGRRIQTIAPNFTRGNYSHRLYFHWGFNVNPRSCAALRERIDLATDSDPVKDQIWRLVRVEQACRDKNMEDAVERAAAASPNTRCEMRSEEVNRIAAILYDTHILGDYIEHKGTDTEKPLLDLDLLEADVIESIQRIARVNMDAFSHGGSSPEIRAFINQMRACRSPSTKQRAEDMLNVMERHIPFILSKCRRIKKAFVLQDRDPPQ